MTNNRQKGFTLVELTIAMLFVSFLLLSFATMTIRLGRMYEKGITIKTVNQAGREIFDSIEGDLASSGGEVKFTKTSSGFRICSRNVAYVGNYGESINNNDLGNLKNKATGEVIRFARIEDGGVYRLCEDVSLTVLDYPNILELMKHNNIDMAVHKIDLEEIISSGNDRIYKIDFLVGTNKRGLIDENNRCRLDSDQSADASPDYNHCSTANFNALIRVGNI